jgi:predicted deacylase
VASIAFDVETAPASACTILGAREFAIFVTPEHAPPINPSPWYAFRYSAAGSEGISVRLQYSGFRHRYAPWLTQGGTATQLSAEVSEDRSTVRLNLPAGQGIVAAHQLFGGSRYQKSIDRLASLPNAERIELGRSLDGRPLTAVRFGDPTAPALVILLGRQHPPEVTGALAMEAFLHELANQDGRLAHSGVQFLAIPQINPDGVARGHWRANHGGKDLNRDWGDFSQPETRAIKAWLDTLPSGVKPIAMVDFHSTDRNLFYVQSEADMGERQERFLSSWLKASQAFMPDYPFSIERRDANPGLGTAKNWFHRTYDIPAYTYEVADNAPIEAIDRSATLLARSFLDQLHTLIH